MRRGLRTQIALSIMLIVFGTVAVIGFLSNLLIGQAFERYVAQQQHLKTEDIVSNINEQYDPWTHKWNVDFIHGVGMYALNDGYIIKVYDQDGQTVWDAENHDMARCRQMMEEITLRMAQHRPELHGSFVSKAYDLQNSDQKIGIITVTYYGPYFLSENDFRFLDDLNIALLFIGITALTLSLVTGVLIARRIARPITKTAYIARQISEGNYAIRFEGRTKIAELDELVTAVNQLAAALDEQEKLRKQLTSDVAHELRTPLTTVASHLEAMIEGVWQPTPERLQSCHEEIGRLTGLVKDLERLSKAEGDNLRLDKKAIDLLEIARSVSGRFEMEFQKKNIIFSVGGEAAVVCADAGRISQVVTNLLSNAVKYTADSGHITVRVVDSDKCGILTVEDDGIGISPQELTLIFERFYRTDKSRNRKTGGAGIGLAVVKSIVTAHGGTVRAESDGEHGSRFIVELRKE